MWQNERFDCLTVFVSKADLRKIRNAEFEFEV